MLQQQVSQQTMNTLFKAINEPRTSEKIDSIREMIEDVLNDDASNNALWALAKEICLQLNITPTKNRLIIYNILLTLLP